MMTRFDNLPLHHGYTAEEESSLQRRAAELYQESLTDEERGIQIFRLFDELSPNGDTENAMFDALLAGDSREFGRLILDQVGLRDKLLDELRRDAILKAEAELERGRDD